MYTPCSDELVIWVTQFAAAICTDEMMNSSLSELDFIHARVSKVVRCTRRRLPLLPTGIAFREMFFSGMDVLSEHSVVSFL